MKALPTTLLLVFLFCGAACSADGDAAKPSAIQQESSLDGKVWMWEKTAYNDDRTVEPVKTDAFTLTFDPNGNYSVSTDCNGSAGEYVSDGNSLSFANTGMATLMFCEGSQENDFLAMLQKVESYLFSKDARLVLELKGHAGSMIFR